VNRSHEPALQDASSCDASQEDASQEDLSQEDLGDHWRQLGLGRALARGGPGDQRPRLFELKD
jgi:hypothetical protein